MTNAELNNIYNMDCVEGMEQIPDKSIDMILCDLPYGSTICKWDFIIPFELLWEQYRRIIKKNGAIVLTATQPFSSSLVASNIKGFKHEWIWQKERGVGFQVAKYRPIQEHEHILVFTKNGERVNYYPIMEPLGKPKIERGASTKSESSPIGELDPSYKREVTHRYPKSIRRYKRDSDKLHPTQKPVALFEYLIKTYSNEGDTILDNCMGSGTTAIASINTGRNFIGFESDTEYCNIANKRIDHALKQQQTGVDKR